MDKIYANLHHVLYNVLRHVVAHHDGFPLCALLHLIVGIVFFQFYDQYPRIIALLWKACSPNNEGRVSHVPTACQFWPSKSGFFAPNQIPKLSFPAGPIYGSNLRIGLKYKIFFLLLVFIAKGQSLPPLLDLNNGFGSYQINVNNLSTLSLEYYDTQTVLYSADLVQNRQLYQISKILDHSQLALANFNTANKMSQLNSPADISSFEQFKIYHNTEYFLSPDYMQFQDCQFDCASRDSSIISSYMDYFRIPGLKR